jgi:hypothetical protein
LLQVSASKGHHQDNIYKKYKNAGAYSKKRQFYGISYQPHYHSLRMSCSTFNIVFTIVARQYIRHSFSEFFSGTVHIMNNYESFALIHVIIQLFLMHCSTAFVIHFVWLGAQTAPEHQIIPKFKNSQLHSIMYYKYINILS